MSDLNSPSRQPPHTPDGMDLVKAIIKNQNNHELSEGFVWTSNEYFIEVKLPGETDLAKNLPVDSRAKVYVKNPFANDVCYYVIVAEVRDHTARLKIRHKEYPSNNREYYRVATNLNTVIEHQLIGEEKMRLPHPLRITVKNLSCGGMMFMSSTNLSEGD